MTKEMGIPSWGTLTLSTWGNLGSIVVRDDDIDAFLFWYTKPSNDYSMVQYRKHGVRSRYVCNEPKKAHLRTDCELKIGQVV